MTPFLPYAIIILMRTPTKVNVLGLGYVGVATSIYLSQLGHDVSGWDIDPERVRLLKNGTLPYPDPDLLDCFATLQQKNATFQVCTLAEDLPQAKVWMIAVSTPLASNGNYDLTRVRDALLRAYGLLAQQGTESTLILLRSTLPPGAMKDIFLPELEEFFRERQLNPPRLAYFPEFFREGAALKDTKNPPLRVLGVAAGFQGAGEVEELFDFPRSSLEVCDPTSAEMVKVASNAFHAMKVAFANEVGALSRAIGGNGTDVMRIFCRDTTLNISPYYLRPGFVFGGPCLEKEVGGLDSLARERKMEIPLLRSVLPSNEAHLSRFTRFLREKEIHSLAVLGSGFKSGSCDTRNSPVLRLLHEAMAMKQLNQIYLVEMEALNHAPAFTQTVDLEIAIDAVDWIALGSRNISAAEVALLLASHKPMLDLGLNFYLDERLKQSPLYHSLI